MYRKIAASWLIEFGPILVFFVAFETMRFIPATTVFVITTVLAFVAGHIKDRKLAIFPVIAGSFVILFGLATIVFHDPRFFMFRDTIYHGVLGLILLIGYFRGKLPLKRMFQSLFAINDHGWRILSIAWMIFFFVVTITNEIVWRNFSEPFWVNFKIGVSVCTILFGVLQVPVAWKTRLPEANSWGLKIKH